MAARRQSSYVAVTRALLTAGAALALTRVFAGLAWLVPALIAAALPGTVLAFGERRRWNPWAATGLAVVLGAWFTMLVNDPSETVLTVPSASALANFGRDLGQAPHVLRSAVVPVQPVGAALTLAVIAILVTALATELIARRLDAPVGAIGPSIALFVAICALGSGRWATTTALYGIAVVEYLVALQYAELLTRRTWFQSSGNRRSQLAVGGAGAGVLVVAIALVFGPGVPGARSAAWIEYRSLGTGKGSSILSVTSPLVSVKAKLSDATDEEVFSVSTTEPRGDYWRVIALDQLQNDGWGLNSEQKSASKLPGPTHAPGTTNEKQTFTLGPIDARWLPAAYRPTQIDLPGAQVLPDSTSLFLDRPLPGLKYTVESEVSNPSKQVLNAVSFDDLQDMAADTAIPPDLSGDARQFATEAAKNATTPYEKALALMQRFHAGDFVYDQSVNLGADGHALDTFLFRTKKGFCEQFASAYAELARSLGLPTRVAVGYTPGKFDKADGRWHVTEKDAHAWPEVWLGHDVGWYRFEPTPTRNDPITGLPGRAGSGGNGGPTTTTPPTTIGPNTPTTNAAAGPSSGANFPNERSGGGTAQSTTRAHVLTGIAITVAALLFAVIVLALAFAIAAWRRSNHRRHDPDTRRRVLSAWSEALERLSAAGIERRPSATSVEFAMRQAPALGAGAAGPPLMSLARLHTAAMYSLDAPSREDADAAWSDVDAISSALRTTTPASKRVRARWKALLPRRLSRPETADPSETESDEF
jgi:transglutaminase-like putative cysteine protease